MKKTAKAAVGYALCGSFCTFSRTLEQMEALVRLGYDVIPFMSETAYSTDTRFGRAEDFIHTIETICGHPVIHTISGAEPVGPKRMVDPVSYTHLSSIFPHMVSVFPLLRSVV